MDLRLTGKRAIITGGSRGIGRATARQLALEGCNVVIGSRTESRLKEAADAINAEVGAERVSYLTFNAQSAESIREFIEQAANRLGGVDILVNNAARTGGGMNDHYENASEEQIVTDFEEKVVGYLRCARAVEPYMKANGWGRIINLAGGAGRVRGALMGSGTRNAATRQLTISLANSLGGYGINVICVSPGSTLTEDVIERHKVTSAKQGKSLDEFMHELAQKTLLKHIVTAEDVGYVIAFACSPLSVSLTGVTLDVNGGTSPDVIY
jgi:NAD(P)-dependent dehydrogenase (short-subunit alcohol dehydrogenase family)